MQRREERVRGDGASALTVEAHTVCIGFLCDSHIADQLTKLFVVLAQELL